MTIDIEAIKARLEGVTEGPFVPVPGQSFRNQQEWVCKATSRLTAHPEYRNTEHDGPPKGWRGYHFTALCFDQKGRRCRNGGDFQRAEDDGAYPIWWVWPDQIAPLLIDRAAARTDIPALIAEVERLREDLAEMTRRRDEWRKKAEGYDALAAAVRAGIEEAGEANLSRVFLRGALVDSEKRLAKALAEVERLRGLLSEARSDLADYVAHDYPARDRSRYPGMERRYQRDMDICYRIDDALKGVDDG